MKIKSILIVVVLATTIFCFGNAVVAQTPTIAQLQAQIQALMKQLQALQAGQGATTQSWCHTFNYNMSAGQKIAGSDIDALTTVLQKEGLADQGTTFSGYDENLASAVSGFQEKYASEILTPNDLKHGTGIVGKATRAKLNALYGCGDQTQVQPTVTNLVTPQQIQTPTTNTSTLNVPTNGTLCNGVYYNQCAAGNNFVCPNSGAAYCQPQQNPQQNPIQLQFNQQNQSSTQGSPQQNGMPPPPDCVGKTAATANLPQDCQIYFGLLSQPANNQQQNSTNSSLSSQSICMIYGPFAKNMPSACSMGSTPPPDCVGILPTNDSQVPSDCRTFITNQMMQGGNQQNMPPVHCVFYTPFSANTPSECKQYQGITVPSDCVGIQPTSLSGLPSDCVTFMQNQMQMNQPQNSPQNPPSQSPLCGGPGQVWCPSPAGTGGWCQMPPCPPATSQSNSNQQNQSSTQGSPQQNGMPPPPDCVGKTAATANLPQDCQIYFGLMSQPPQSQPPASNPTSMNVSQNNMLASVLESLKGVVQEVQDLIKQ